MPSTVHSAPIHTVKHSSGLVGVSGLLEAEMPAVSSVNLPLQLKCVHVKQSICWILLNCLSYYVKTNT